jgi:D-glycero-alpha-D-manno-heptose-7-phosphate kinase
VTHRAVSSSHASGHGPAAHADARTGVGGGWTDVPPYADRVGGFVCNVAIARHATVRLADGGAIPPGGGDADEALARAALRRAGVAHLRAEVRSDFPVGAGLGGSSAAGVALQAALAAWHGESVGPDTLARRSREVEVEELGVAGGWQDHFAAAHGGALGIRFAPSGIEVRRIPLARDTVRALERQCIVAYTGEARVSARTITGVLDAWATGDATVTSALARMAELAERMAEALGAGRVDDLGLLVGEHWAWQRALHPAIPTPAIDRMIDDARRAGAHGAKALGASGGGCVLAIAPAARADEVRRTMERLGAVLPFAVDLDGAVVLPSSQEAR